MSVVRDLVNSVDNSKEETEEVKESLHILMDLCESKASVFEENIKNQLLTGKTIDDLTVSITKVLTKDVEFRASTSNSNIGSEVATSVSNIFTGDVSIAKGICNIVGKCFDALMGIGEGQEMEIRKYLVVAEYPSIVRYDFAFWSRKISAASIKKYAEDAYSCVAYKSAVDTSKLQFNDFLALYGPILNASSLSKDDIKKFILEAHDIYGLYKEKNGLSKESIGTSMNLKSAKPEDIGKVLNGKLSQVSAVSKATVGNF